MPKEKIYIQHYEIDGSVLKVTTGSGTKYELSQKSCTCKGFGFRRNCGHMKEAKAKGLLAQLTVKDKKKARVRSRNPARTKLRKNALRKFLEKNKVSYDEVLIDNLEKVITQDTTTEKVLELVEADGRAVKVLKGHGI